MKPREIDKILAKESAELLEDLKSGEPGVNERLDAFVSESRRHIQHFLMMVALDQELAHVDPERKWDIRAPDQGQSDSVVPLPNKGEGPPTSASRSSWLRWGLAAAGVMGLVLASAVWWWVSASGTGWHEYATAIGEQRAIELADGSVVHLNTQSHLQALITPEAREIRLLAGEALFKVHHETRRPFRVHSGDVTVIAVGTQFNVLRRPEGGSTVAVVEGRVMVESADGGSADLPTPSTPTPGQAAARPIPSPHVTSLSVGQRAEIRKNGEIVTERISNISAVTDWQRRRLPFQQTPLSRVVEEFNRYNREPRLVVEGEAAERPYSGIFDADDPESLIKLLEREPDLHVERNGSTVLIRAAGARPVSSVIAESQKQ